MNTNHIKINNSKSNNKYHNQTKSNTGIQQQANSKLQIQNNHKSPTQRKRKPIPNQPHKEIITQIKNSKTKQTQNQALNTIPDFHTETKPTHQSYKQQIIKKQIPNNNHKLINHNHNKIKSHR